MMIKRILGSVDEIEDYLDRYRKLHNVEKVQFGDNENQYYYIVEFYESALDEPVNVYDSTLEPNSFPF